MTTITGHAQFPLVSALVRAVTHPFAPLAALVLVALVGLIVAVVLFGPVALTMAATALVPVIGMILIGFAQP